MGTKILNSTYGILGAATYFIQAAVAYITANPLFFGVVLLLLLSSNKSVQLGKFFKAKG